MKVSPRDEAAPESNVEIIDVQLVSAEPGPSPYKLPVAKRLAYWAFYGGLAYASLKGFELHSGTHAPIAFEVGESAITGTAAAAFMVRVHEKDIAKKRTTNIPTE